MGRHDLSYRLFFSHRRMVQDLLREIVGERWAERIDFKSGHLVNTTFISPRHEHRESDLVWRFRRLDGGEPVFVYILMEFQSRPDPSMPARLMTYVGLLYERLISRRRSRKSWKKLPLIIPVVIYNGVEPWDVSRDLGSLIGDLDPSAEIYRPQLRYLLVDESRYSQETLAGLASPVAELFRIETSRNGREIQSSVRRLRQTIPRDEATLREAFETWLAKVVLPRLSGEAFGMLTLEEIETVLLENIDSWNRKLREEGRQEGHQEGRQEGRQEAAAQVLLRQLRLKFGPLAPEVEERVRTTNADRLLEWSERILTSEHLQEVFRD